MNLGTVSTEKQSKPWLFGPGNNANPLGRPKGSRNKLSDSFVQALNADFEEHGVKVIATVRTERPQDYLKVIASILPKQLEIKEGAFDGISDDILTALVLAARSALGIVEGSGTGESAKVIEGSAQVVSSVPETT